MKDGDYETRAATRVSWVVRIAHLRSRARLLTLIDISEGAPSIVIRNRTSNLEVRR